MSNLFNANNDGVDGTKVLSVAGDYFIMVGSDENTYPSTTIDPTGMQTSKTVITPSAGAVKFDSAMTKCRELDTSHLFQTGNLKVWTGNNITLSSGSGGIVFDTTGNVKINSGGGMTAITSDVTIDMTSKTMQMTASEGVRMSADNVQMDCKNTNFSGNVDFGKNMKLEGSLAVQGELYSTHITAQKQIMLTDEAGGPAGFLNPIQSFAVVNGSSLCAKALNIIGRPMVPPPVSNTGMVDVVLDLGLIASNPTMVEAAAMTGGAPAMMLAGLLSGPINVKLGFPNGVHLISNTAFTNDTASVLATVSLESFTPGTLIAPSMTDITGASHQHQYYIPACTLVDSTDAVWSAAQACNKDEAAPANPMQPFGMGQSEFIKKSMEMAAKHQLENSSFVKKIKSFFGF